MVPASREPLLVGHPELCGASGTLWGAHSGAPLSGRHPSIREVRPIEGGMGPAPARTGQRPGRGHGRCQSTHPAPTHQHIKASTVPSRPTQPPLPKNNPPGPAAAPALAGAPAATATRPPAAGPQKPASGATSANRQGRHSAPFRPPTIPPATPEWAGEKSGRLVGGPSCGVIL